MAIELKIVCQNDESAKNLRDKICTLFSGCEDFKNNKLIVTPVSEEDYYDYHSYQYRESYFYVSYNDPSVDKYAIITDGESLMDALYLF